MDLKQVAQAERDRVDMETIVALYGYKPDRHGFMPCPFHSEKTASFRVYKGRGGCHCFGCGFGGSIIDFVMKHENCGFADAVVAIDRVLNLGLIDHHEDPAEARVKMRIQHQLDLFVDAVIAYCDAVIGVRRSEQDRMFKRHRELEEKIAQDKQSVTTAEWTEYLAWDEDDYYTEYLIETVREFEAEVLAWRRARRTT